MPFPSYPSLKGDDGGFTKQSILERLPLIVRETSLKNEQGGLINTSASNALNSLADDIASNGIVVALLPNQKEELWMLSYTKSFEGINYLSVPWFFLENYIYKRILDITSSQINDPFILMKSEAIKSAQHSFLKTVLPLLKESNVNASSVLRAALYRSLWGNKADLSLSAGVVVATTSTESELSNLLADDSDKAVELLLSDDGSKTEVVILLDNCGLELLSDLVFCLVLLKTNPTLTIVLMTKTSPVFVSDVVLKVDVDSHVTFIKQLIDTTQDQEEKDLLIQCGNSLKEYFTSGRIIVESDDFFTSPLASWNMPEKLRSRLSRNNRLTISKGDANYRRLLGDCHWPHDTSFQEATSYFPTSLLALRTTKAGVIVGVNKETEERVSSLHTNWLVSGEFGVIQLKI
jgi:uncharacterized protein with ATP-grasp and redox domains